MVVFSLNDIINQEKQIDYIIKLILKTCEHYNNVNLELINLPLTEIQPLSHFVTRERLQRTEKIIDFMLQKSIPCFEAVVVKQDDIFYYIPPPIVEIHNSGIYVIDGVHRLYSLHIKKKSYSMALSVSGDLPDLPCKPTIWENIECSNVQLSLEKMLPGLNRDLFRPITKLMNSPVLQFKSITGILKEITYE